MDFNHRLGRKALRKLRSESIVWLITVGADGQPQPRPVWFHWNGKDVLIFTPPRTAKLRQIAHNPRTAIHFNADREGTDVVVLVGRARIASRVAQDRRAAYLRKYRRNMKDPPSFQSRFSIPVVFRPTALRGH